MDRVVAYLQHLDLHPVVDHFTVAILAIAVLTDLVASILPTRMWVRYMALTLTLLGSLAAACSYFTGGWEAHRIFDALGPEAKAVLHRHAQLGEAMAITFGILAIWRILIQATTTFGNARGLYLIVAFVAVVVVFYVGSLGGQLVYTYGAGTALMSSQPVPLPELPSAIPTPAGPLPTVSVPTTVATPPPAAAASPAAPSAASPTSSNL